MSSPEQRHNLAQSLESPELKEAGMGQEHKKGGFLDWIKGIFGKRREKPSDAELDRLFESPASAPAAEPPKASLPVDSPLQSRLPVEERVQPELAVTPSTGSVYAYIPGKYVRSYSSTEAGQPTSLESVILTVESIAEQLRARPNDSVTINISGLASFEGNREKNLALADKRAKCVENIMRDYFQTEAIDENRIRYIRSASVVQLTTDQEQELQALCIARNTAPEHLIRDHNDEAPGFTPAETDLLDNILARNRGVRVAAMIEKHAPVSAAI